MHIVRSTVEWCRNCQNGLNDIGPHPCGDYAALESRLVFNRFETRLLMGLMWLREQWYERVVWQALRLQCRAFGRHNKSCDGRRDHRPHAV